VLPVAAAAVAVVVAAAETGSRIIVVAFAVGCFAPDMGSFVVAAEDSA